MQQSSPAQINSRANFHICESTGLEFRLEAFNATNTPQFGQPSNVTGFNQYKRAIRAALQPLPARATTSGRCSRR
jgi:hypothetical protein